MYCVALYKYYCGKIQCNAIFCNAIVNFPFVLISHVSDRGITTSLRIPKDLLDEIDKIAGTEFEGNRSLLIVKAAREYLENRHSLAKRIKLLETKIEKFENLIFKLQEETSELKQEISSIPRQDLSYLEKIAKKEEKAKLKDQ